MIVLEDPNNRGSETTANDVECHKTQEGENQRRAVVTGFHDDTTEQDVQHLLKESFIAIGKSTEQIQIKCPAKPITHAFLQFTDNDDRDKFVRSANILKKELRGRKIRISPAMDAAERFHQKNSWISQMLHPHKTRRTTRADQNEQIDKTCIGGRTDSDQNMCKWISQVPQISRHRS